MALVDIEQDSLWKSWRLLQPSHAVLFITENADGTMNGAPFGWVNPASQYPPMVTASLLCKPEKQRSLRNIERTGEFVINIVGLEYAGDLVKCGQKVPDNTCKVELACLDVVSSKAIKPPRLARAAAALECRARQFVETGDHTLVIADVVAGCYSQEAFTATLTIRAENYKPCLHVEQFNKADSQAHLFLETSGLRLVEADYLIPMAELQKNKDTW